MTIEVRVPSVDELRDVSRVVSVALMFPPYTDAEWEQRGQTWIDMMSVAAFDGTDCVGHAGQFLVDTHVPGGARLSTGAVTRVGVLGTHRRRGIATSLMHGLIERSREAGVVLMSLRASEAVIYQRYGFGVAGENVSVQLDPARLRPLRGATSSGSFRLLRGSEVLATVPDVYDRLAHTRPGTISRPASFWQRYFEHAINETKPSSVVVHLDTRGDVDGYAHYSVSWNEDPAASGGKGQIHDVVAADSGVELALWQYLMEVDLVRTWTAEERPLDDLVREAATDRRAYRITSIHDEQWLRVIDVDQALSAREYNHVAGSVTIDVVDPVLAANNGTWKVDSHRAERVESHRAADIVTGISGLSAAFLGRPCWASLATVGEAEQRTPGALETADRLFASPQLPFCGSFF